MRTIAHLARHVRQEAPRRHLDMSDDMYYQLFIIHIHMLCMRMKTSAACAIYIGFCWSIEQQVATRRV